jgi:hypothetical protein
LQWIERAWKENNVLMVSVIYQKRAWSIYWCLLEKDGSSNLQEQQKVLRPVMRLLKKYKLVIIGDARISQHRTGTLALQAEYRFCTSSKKRTLLSVRNGKNFSL